MDWGAWGLAALFPISAPLAVIAPVVPTRGQGRASLHCGCSICKPLFGGTKETKQQSNDKKLSLLVHDGDIGWPSGFRQL